MLETYHTFADLFIKISLMKNHLFLLLLLTATFMQFGCGSSEPETTETEPTTTEPKVAGDIDYDAMAVEFCACMKPMFEFQEKIMKLAQEGKNDEIEALRDEALKVQTDGQTCVMAIESKYGVVEGDENEAKATAALEKVCPDIMAMMGAEVESLEE